ncbi:MAG: TIGR03905 family TSCPD domain-containing protein [Bacteroidaceae bacterium]|nr:TIGR03905 family TSCPD domain-containing protein [Bacteroidaceae bacterium]MBO7589305.1 TIGR03905 family TSCPD domain-containing protein [Bacteroidaceae bacterium]MBP5646204.1 TIGR03905 family TSCPD domain-containing protein [Bacteroidaceae bacterium]
MKHIQYQTEGTCSMLIDITASDDDVIQSVAFLGGCDGNLQGICRLVTGQKIDQVIERLNGIRCGSKRTSCPDQLCRALEQLRG